MLLGARNFLWGGKKIIPIEYLQTTESGAYINTGKIATNASSIEVVFSEYMLPGRWVFGARSGYKSNVQGLYFENNDNNLRYSWGNKLYPSSSATNVSQKLVVRVSGRAFSLVRMSDSATLYSYTFAAESFATPVPLTLFALNNNGSILSFAQCKIHSTKIDGLDLIPVRVGRDGYMYDQVGGHLFGNSGTGEFALGPDK